MLWQQCGLPPIAIFSWLVDKGLMVSDNAQCKRRSPFCSLELSRLLLHSLQHMPNLHHLPFPKSFSTGVSDIPRLKLAINWSGEEPYAGRDNPVLISENMVRFNDFSAQSPAFKVCRCVYVVSFAKCCSALKVSHLTRLSICVSAPGSQNDM